MDDYWFSFHDVPHFSASTSTLKGKCAFWWCHWYRKRYGQSLTSIDPDHLSRRFLQRASWQWSEQRSRLACALLVHESCQVIDEACLISCRKLVYFFSIGKAAVEGRNDWEFGAKGWGLLEEAGICRPVFRHSTSPLVSRSAHEKLHFPQLQ